IDMEPGHDLPREKSRKASPDRENAKDQDEPEPADTPFALQTIEHLTNLFEIAQVSHPLVEKLASKIS
ncbi:MAG: hypothetical protein ABW174_02340, partial [Flavitalea sp.]